MNRLEELNQQYSILQSLIETLIETRASAQKGINMLTEKKRKVLSEIDEINANSAVKEASKF